MAVGRTRSRQLSQQIEELTRQLRPQQIVLTRPYSMRAEHEQVIEKHMELFFGARSRLLSYNCSVRVRSRVFLIPTAIKVTSGQATRSAWHGERLCVSAVRQIRCSFGQCRPAACRSRALACQCVTMTNRSSFALGIAVGIAIGLGFLAIGELLAIWDLLWTAWVWLWT
jgi:hypothetical protein